MVKIDNKEIEKMRKEVTVPIGIFSDRNYGVLENLCKHLKLTHKFRNCDIAKLLNRDDRTIWTVISRVKTK